MNLQPVALRNAFVSLEPLAERHREDLRIACEADQAIWRDIYRWSWVGEHFAATWARVAATPTIIAYAVCVEGRCRGMTSYLDVSPENASVEVGGTYYHPDLRGGRVNPAAKRLILGHAFDSGAKRVRFSVDALNAHSRRAVLKLGAVEEGTMRQETVVWTGRTRDTVVFSILADEWPAVRDRLDARLA